MINELQTALDHLQQAAGLIAPFEMADLLGSSYVDRAGASIARAVTLITEELKEIEANKLRAWMAACAGVEIIQEPRSTRLKFKSAKDAEEFATKSLTAGKKTTWQHDWTNGTVDIILPDWEAITLGLRRAHGIIESISEEARS